jgi:transposase InsO family protein
MDIHKNARLTFRRRAQLARRVILEQVTVKAAAAEFAVTVRTVIKWSRRYRLEGENGLLDHSSRPFCCPRSTAPSLVQRVEQLRRQRYTGLYIARVTGLSRSTVSRILRRLGLNRIRDLEPPVPIVRYEHPAPGDMLHLDIKQLGRFSDVVVRPDGRRRGKHHSGCEYLHIAIDDHSRIAFAQILPDSTGASAVAFLRAALTHFSTLGIPIRSLLTDNGHCYRSHLFADTGRQLHLRHRFTRPYTPRTNGKAERFIQTSLREWVYAFTYLNSTERNAVLPSWLHYYNWHRPHASLNHAVPISRSGLDRNNLLRLHS